MVELLIKHGANVNTRLYDDIMELKYGGGDTYALHLAHEEASTLESAQSRHEHEI